MFYPKKFIIIFIVLLAYPTAQAQEYSNDWMQAYLNNWPNCDLSNYSLTSKKGETSKGKDIFLIKGKQKKVTLKQVRYNLKANLISKNGYTPRICPFFSLIETFYKKEKLYSISILSTTLENTTANKTPHIHVIEKHTYFENFAKYKQENLDGLGIVDNGIVTQYMVFNIDKKKILQINKMKIAEDQVEFPYITVSYKTRSKQILSNRTEPNIIEDNEVKELLNNKFKAFDNILNNHYDVLFSNSEFNLLEDHIKEIGYVRYQTRD